MPSSIPHQKFCFYHLPTRGRAGIKLGDAWYVSNVSIIFDCFMLYYLLFWTILGFIFHFYIIFGTNLLTGGPAQNCYFLPVLGFRRKGISNGVQMEWNLRERDFFIEYNSGDLDPTSSHVTWAHEVGARLPPQPPNRALHPRGAHVAPPTYFFLLYIPMYPQTTRCGAKNLIPPPQPSVPVRSHLGAFSGVLPEGALITEGFYINTIAPSMKCE